MHVNGNNDGNKGKSMSHKGYACVCVSVLGNQLVYHSILSLEWTVDSDCKKNVANLHGSDHCVLRTHRSLSIFFSPYLLHHVIQCESLLNWKTKMYSTNWLGWLGHSHSTRWSEWNCICYTATQFECEQIRQWNAIYLSGGWGKIDRECQTKCTVTSGLMGI